jgi:hypothetical protein
MRKVSVLFFIVMAALTVGARAAKAQAGLPPGDFQEACKNVAWDKTTLAADCDNGNGVVSHSSIVVGDCAVPQPTVNNHLGFLQCYATWGTWGKGRTIPHGSYFDACQDITVDASSPDHPWLKAMCGAKEVKLDLGTCKAPEASYAPSKRDPNKLVAKNDIEFVGGELKCTAK